MVHVGLDLHHRNSYVRALTDDGELIAGQRIYHSNIDELWQYLKQFGDEPKRVVFEAVGNSRWMKKLLSEDPTIEAVVVTPHKVRIIAETVAKTDKIDALVLAELSKIDALPRAWIPDEGVEALREITRHRAALVQLRTRAKNQANGLLVRLGKLRPHQDIFGPLGRAWLEQLELAPQPRMQLDQWLGMIDFYDQQIAPIERHMYQKLAKDDACVKSRSSQKTS
jgi:transposase